MGVLERYYSQTAALSRIDELLTQGKIVFIHRDKDDGAPVWKVTWK